MVKAKKSVSLLLAALMIISMFAALPFSASAIPKPPKPEAQVAPLDNLNITVDGKAVALDAGYVFSFKDGEPTAAQLEAYGTEPCDYYITFSSAVKAGDVTLYGQFGDYAWRAVDLPVDVAANTPVALCGTILGENVNLLALSQGVSPFYCGIVNNTSDTVTADLKLTVDEETVAEQAEVELAPAKPEAQVEALDNLNITVDGKAVALDAGYKFSFKDGEPTQAQLAAYGTDPCDYYITFSSAVKAGDVTLYGQFGDYAWRAVDLPVDVAANTPVALCGTILNESVNLLALSQGVSPFYCGIVNNTSDTVTADLKLTVDEETVAEQAEVELAPAKPEAQVEALDNLNITVNGEAVALDAGYKFSFKAGEPTAAQLAAYGTDPCDYYITFSSAVKAGDVTLYGQFGDYAWRAVDLPVDVAANTPVALCKDILGEEVNLLALSQGVSPFYCGVKNNSSDDIEVTLDLKVDNDVVATEETEIPAAEAAYGIHVYGAKLVLEGKIIIRFGVTIPEDSKADTITIALNGRTRTVSVATPDSADSNYKYFDFAVYANEMDDMVRLTVKDAQGNSLKIEKNDLSLVDAYEYSINTYIDNMTNNSEATQDLKEFIAVIKSYGEYAKYYFENRSALTSLDNITPAAPEEGILEDYRAVAEPDLDYSGPQYVGGSLALIEGTSIMIYFTGDIDGCKFFYGDYDSPVLTQVTPVQNGEYYYVTIPNVSARDLDRMFTVYVLDANGYSLEVSCSAMNYVRTVLNSATASRSLKDVCIKLYDYAMAANDYFND
ncbi:MAG: hypothetical protein K6B52_00905 [Clostridiales bacterium]|nr:hypothetical protein [Clostridiales bacterium]